MPVVAVEMGGAASARPTGDKDFLSRLEVAERNDAESTRKIQEALNATVSLDKVLMSVQEPCMCIGGSPVPDKPIKMQMTANASLTRFHFILDNDDRKMYTISLGGSRHKINGKTLRMVHGDNDGVEMCSSLFSTDSIGRHVKMTVLRSRPSFDHQVNEAIQVGSTVKLDRYAFAEISYDTTPSLKTSVTATYSLVTGHGELTPLYRARRFQSMRYVAVVETMDGTPLAKFTQNAMPSKLTLNRHATVDIVPGVDTAAIALLGSSIVADWSSARTGGGTAKLVDV